MFLTSTLLENFKQVSQVILMKAMSELELIQKIKPDPKSRVFQNFGQSDFSADNQISKFDLIEFIKRFWEFYLKYWT